MIKKLRGWLWTFKPRIYYCRDVIMIRVRDKEFILPRLFGEN